jgi:hypothetical protein
MGHADNVRWKIAVDAHAHDGGGISEVNHVEMLADAGFGWRDPCEGDRDDHNVVDLDKTT